MEIECDWFHSEYASEKLIVGFKSYFGAVLCVTWSSGESSKKFQDIPSEIHILIYLFVKMGSSCYPEDKMIW